MHPTIMLIEPDPRQRKGFKEAIKDSKYRVVKEVSYGDEAVESYEEVSPSVVIVDLGTPGSRLGGGIGGINIVKKILEMDKELRLIVSHTTDTKYLVMRAIKDGAIGQVAKPYKRQEVLDALANAFSVKSGEEAVRRQAVRLRNSLPVYYKLCGAGFFTGMKPAFSDDISIEGIGFRTQETLPQGTVLRIKIELPVSGRVVKAEARVMRSKRVPVSSMHEVGVLFTKIGKEDRKAIRQFITDVTSKDASS